MYNGHDVDEREIDVAFRLFQIGQTTGKMTLDLGFQTISNELTNLFISVKATLLRGHFDDINIKMIVWSQNRVGGWWFSDLTIYNYIRNMI